LLVLLQAQRDEIQKKLNDANKTITESETNLLLAVAEAKRTLHASMEAKDDELAQFREAVRQADARNIELKQQLENLLKSGLGNINFPIYRLHFRSVSTNEYQIN
jgi:regulator of protease activity HflC (stomatin/prohibitin superfamily)